MTRATGSGAFRSRTGGWIVAALLLGIGSLLLIGGLPIGPPDIADPAARACTATHPVTLAGASLVSPRRPMPQGELAALERIGAGWVAILPYARLEADGRVRYASEGGGPGFEGSGAGAGEGGERERGGSPGGSGFSSSRPEVATHSIDHARAQGLRVMLKPHLWQGRDWVGDFAPGNDAEWALFEESYRRYILDFARLADSLEVELFVVGTELDRTVRDRPALWQALIRDVRSVFGGKLTYAANWDGYRDVPFWAELDFIGVDAFFPLSPAPTPTIAALERSWAPIVEDLAALCREVDRPVLFTEFGYRSIDGAAGPQWEMPPEGDPTTPVNLEAQENAYRAFFRSWWTEPWVAGGFLWKWFPEDARFGDLHRADYTPQHKPVEAIIRSWYGERERSAASGPGR